MHGFLEKTLKLNENFRLSLCNILGFIPVVLEFCSQVLEYLSTHDKKKISVYIC